MKTWSPAEKNRSQKLALTAIALAIGAHSFLAAPSALAREDLSDAEKQIEQLSTEILLHEIDFERCYLQYRMYGTKDPKYRRMRYFLLQLAAGSTGLASNILFTKVAKEAIHSNEADFGKGDANIDSSSTNSNSELNSQSNEETASSQPSTASKATETTTPTIATTGNTEDFTIKELKSAFILSIVATALDASSSLIEMSSNGYTAIKNIKKKLSPKDSVNNTKSRIETIDALFAKRQELIDRNPDSSRNGVNAAETRVLKNYRDWCLAEYADVYATVKSSQSSYNIYYAIDMASAGWYLASSALGLKALNAKHEKLGGPACYTAIVGDGLGITAVPLSTWGGNWLYSYYRNKLKKQLKEELKDTEIEAKASLENLNKELASADIGLLESTKSLRDRIAVYVLWYSRYDKNLSKQIAELRHQARVAHQGLIAGPLISGSYLAADILATVAFYGVPNRPRAGATLTYAGGVSGTAGAGFTIGLTNYILANELLHRRKLKKQNILPSQLLAERLKTLEDLEGILSKNNSRLPDGKQRVPKNPFAEAK